MKPCLFHFLFIHFVFASFASIVISCHYWLATNNAGREVSSTFPATGVVLAYCVFAVSAWTFQLFPWSLLWGVLGKDTHSHINILFTLFDSSHSLKFYKRSWALFVTLILNKGIPCCNKQTKRPEYKSFWGPCQVRSRSAWGRFSRRSWTGLRKVVFDKEYKNARPQPLSRGCWGSYLNLCWCRLWLASRESVNNYKITLVVFEVWPVIVASTSFFL